MRQTVIVAAAAFLVGGIATGAVLSQAQQPAAPSEQADGMAAEHHWAGGWEHHPGPDGHRWWHRHHDGHPFALIYRQQDRQLVPADVEKIVEGFLLWNGNHTWKVTEIAAMPDGPIGFSLTTQDGSVIAKFTIDPHSAKIRRVG